jgi:hypothetical protein
VTGENRDTPQERTIAYSDSTGEDDRRNQAITLIEDWPTGSMSVMAMFSTASPAVRPLGTQELFTKFVAED